LKIFLGIFLASLCNFFLGLLGYGLVESTNFIVYTSQLNFDPPSNADYLYSFGLKFTVIATLTWILHKVMPMLDKPKKRILFIYLLGTIFSIYAEVDVFWKVTDISWSITLIVAGSFNWLVTGLVLSKFIKPKHLGAL